MVRTTREPVGSLLVLQHVVAVEVPHPVGLVDGVEVALAEVRGEGDCGELFPGVMAAEPGAARR